MGSSLFQTHSSVYKYHLHVIPENLTCETTDGVILSKFMLWTRDQKSGSSHMFASNVSLDLNQVSKPCDHYFPHHYY